ncbi:MAG: CoA pyrophosphatase [Dehalococcoidia bacterium]
MRDRVRLAVSGHAPTELPLEGHRDAAVFLLLHEVEGIEHLIFQVRSSTLAHHSGQISFPGGTRDPADGTLLETALREVEEEIGVPRDHIEVFGRIDDAFTQSSNYRMRPYVGALQPGPRDFAIDAREVHQLLSVPLEFLMSPEARGWQAVDRDGALETVPGFVYGEHIIWGATARVLERFLGVLGGYE